MTTYVYGITRADAAIPEVHADGVGSADLRPVGGGDVVAVVQDVGDTVAGATARSVRAHARVLEELALRTTVLPVRFGTVLEDDDAVVDRILAPHADALVEMLDRLEGHIQVTIKAFQDEERLLRDIAVNDPTVSRLRRRVAGVDPAAAYYDRIELGRQVASALQERKSAIAARLLPALSGASVDTVQRPLRLERLVLDADFLVPRDGVSAFDATVDQLATHEQDLEFKYLGPMPPYSFADVQIGG